MSSKLDMPLPEKDIYDFYLLYNHTSTFTKKSQYVQASWIVFITSSIYLFLSFLKFYVYTDIQF